MEQKNTQKQKEAKGFSLSLESDSGFMMPFLLEEHQDLQITLGYGEQNHPATGQPFIHKGIDFMAPHVPLFALASGLVVGVGTDAIHQDYIINRYGKFEVKYGHISQAFVKYGQPVIAGQQVAMSGDFLHLGVKSDGLEIDPLPFLAMIYGNIEQLAAFGIKSRPQFVDMGIHVRTKFDKDREELEKLLIRWFPQYMSDLAQGLYLPSPRTEAALRLALSQSAEKGYFFESAPTASNPLGLCPRCEPLVGKLQSILLEDFLVYLGYRYNTYLSTWGEDQKKKFKNRQQPMAF